jgi:anti-sigma B factor antagonist
MNAKRALGIEAVGSNAVVSFASSCVSDVEEISHASAQIREYIEQRQPVRMVFDFSGVKFFSSQVLGLLLEARGQLQSRSGQVIVASLEPQLERVFKITNLDRIFTFVPDKDGALGEAAGAPG